MARCLQERREFRGAEIVIERPDGSRCLVQATATPFFDSRGRLIGGSNVLTDLTELRQVEQARSQLAAIVESSEDAIIGKDADGVITSWNRGAERLYGYTAEEAVGRPISFLHPPDHPDEFPEIMRRLLRGERIDHLETVRRRKDGGRVDVSLTISPIIDADGKIVGASIIARDITDRKRAEEALRRSEALLQAELEDAKLLQEISAALISEENVEALYDKILDAASAIMRSDFASMQMLYPERGERGELRLLGSRGFPPEAVRFWEWVRADSNCTCGIALRTGERVIDADVANSAIMAGTEDQAALVRSGILAAQSTPLVGRDGRMLGMITTHWGRPHQPAERELRLMDVLARQAADLLERRRADEEIKSLNDRLASELAAMTRMQQLSMRLVQASDFNLLLEEILHAAIEVTNADMGNVQLLIEDQLHITAQRGFGAPFLDFFRAVHNRQAACGAALEAGVRVIVEDVANSPVFAGTPSREVMLAAGARAVQSTPLVSRSGRVLGMFSTHYRAPRRPTEHETRLLDLLARQAADLIERMQAEDALRRQTDRVRLLWEAAAVLLTAGDPDAMLHGLFARIGPHLNADVYFNYMVNEAGDALRLASCEGISLDTANQITRLEFGQAICGTVALQRESIVADHIQQSDDPKALLVKSFGLRAYACYPLMADDVLLGTLSFASRQKDEFDPEELEFLWTITRYVTVAYERVRLIQRLREADRRKDEFLAMLAHELRNPLAPIRMAVRIVREDGAEEATLARNHAIIERQVGHMARLLDDLLDVSRITRGMVRLDREPLDLGEVVQATVDACRTLFEDKTHQLFLSVPSEPLCVEGDHVRLEQVVVNLLTNAAKYTDPGGRIEVELLREGDDAVLCVRDTGRGIEPELLPHVFELFRQGERALDRSQGGLGIGLTLVKNLVELHAGRIEARSEGGNRGSEFIVRLPLVKVARPREELKPASSRTASQTAAPSSGGRVLVVDDNQDGAISLAEILSLWGFEVQAVHDGATALREIQANGVDVVLLDIGMPGMDGYQVARRIREKQRGNGPVLIAMTGYGRVEDRQEAWAAGFDHHLTKPIDPDQVRQLLQRALGRE